MSSYDTEGVLQQLLEQMPNTYAKTVGYPVYDLLAAVAVEGKTLYEKAAKIEEKLDIENLTGEELTRRVYQLTGVLRREAVAAVGEVTVTGTGTIQVGNLFSTQDGIQFRSTEEKSIVESGNVLIEAVIAGESGNVGAGSITKIPVTIPGFSKVTNVEPTRNGYRAENDEELKARFYDDLQKPIVSGNANHYTKWAEEVAGVGKAKCFPLAYGENTVEVCIIGNDGKPAAPELVEAVQNYIDPGSTGRGEGEAPAGAYCTVTSATAKEIQVEATVVLASGFDLENVKAATEERLQEALREKAFDGTYLSYALIGNLIFETAGVLDYHSLLVNGGTANIDIGEREVATLGTVVLNV